MSALSYQCSPWQTRPSIGGSHYCWFIRLFSFCFPLQFLIFCLLFPTPFAGANLLSVGLSSQWVPEHYCSQLTIVHRWSAVPAKLAIITYSGPVRVYNTLNGIDQKTRRIDYWFASTGKNSEGKLLFDLFGCKLVPMSAIWPVHIWQVHCSPIICCYWKRVLLASETGNYWWPSGRLDLEIERKRRRIQDISIAHRGKNCWQWRDSRVNDLSDRGK